MRARSSWACAAATTARCTAATRSAATPSARVRTHSTGARCVTSTIATRVRSSGRCCDARGPAWPPSSSSRLLGTGAHPLSRAFVETVLDLRDEHGFLLVADEVATGFGRTGPLFASREWSRSPDLLVLSKALTNGALGAAAVLVGARVAAEFADRGAVFVHGETQAGTPTCAAAVSAVVEEFRGCGMRDAIARVSAGVRALADGLLRDGLAIEVRGRGAFLGLALADPVEPRLPAARVAELVAAIHTAGAIVHPGVDGIQLLPAYGYTDADFAELDAAIRVGLARMAERWS